MCVVVVSFCTFGMQEISKSHFYVWTINLFKLVKANDVELRSFRDS